MLSQDEVRAFFRFFSLPESAADILFDAMDDDRSGTIDYVEFMTMFGPYIQPTQAHKRRESTG